MRKAISAHVRLHVSSADSMAPKAPEPEPEPEEEAPPEPETGNGSFMFNDRSTYSACAPTRTLLLARQRT